MESVNIEKLLEAYFEGNTTLNEEVILRTYFTEKEVEPQFQMYAPLFAGLKAAKQEVATKEPVLPESLGINRSWWYGIAASAAIVVLVAGFMFSRPSITAQEQEALTAFNESKKAMLILSENFNKGTGHLAIVNEFNNTKNRILK
ncbi:hypothetical protein [Ulvibacter antarcticus]|uniref:Uncharacterized protein n=1 Tax=Ulvibacter antarcticus TaxID=442714 RepID=A0A3L9YWC8_9FLAO|nr:hypothetical protein [Ulvibacter antarcticus]RMA64624.1 hypothetical protein BXY75_1502 [Ulvibacter antarcticus]